MRAFRALTSRPIAILGAVMVLGAVWCTSAFAVAPSPQLLTRMANDPALEARIEDALEAQRARGVEAPASIPIGPGGAALAAGVSGPSTALMQVQPAPPAGTTRLLTLLVDFSDKPATTSATSLSDLLYKDVIGKASVRGYFREVSAGALDLTAVNSDLPSAIGWLRLPQTYAYYRGTNYGTGTYPNNTQKMTEDAIAAADAAGVDFSQYDNDGNGYVDGIVIIHAGSGAELTGSTSDIWSHAWGIMPDAYDGVLVSSYSTEPEYWYTPGDMTVGVYCHELGHTFGLPDFYDTDGSSYGVGRWSLMASGSWNGTLGNSPSRPDAWSQIKLGFTTPTTVTSQMTPAHIRSATQADTGTILRIERGAGTSGAEYFLVENRQRTFTDASLPGAGVLVWHVDDTRTNNANEARYWLDLEEAHGGTQHLVAKTNLGDMGDVFPGAFNKTTFSDTTDPNATYYDTVASRILIDRVSASGAEMTALIFPDTSVATTDTAPPVTSSDAKASYLGTATISITATDGVGGYGVKSTTWTLDDVVGSGSVATTTVQGDHTLKFSSTDWAGNVEETKTALFRVVAPTLPAGTVDVDHPATTLPCGATFEFAQVDSTGTVTCTHSAPSRAVPAGRVFLTDLYFDLSTTALFTGPVTIRHGYDPGVVVGFDEAELRLHHFTGGAWVDVTTGVDAGANVISGTTTSFSDFTITGPLFDPPVSTTPASSAWSLALVAALGMLLIGARSLARTRRE